MALRNNYSQDDTHVQHIKHIEESMIPYVHNLEQIMHFSKRNILPTFAQLVDTDKTYKKDLSQEYINEENIASVISQNNVDNAVLESQDSELKKLEEKEMALKTDMKLVTHKLRKLELIREKNKQSEIKQKLTICRNFAKISKKLTAASFDYQGPNVSGFIASTNKLQPFDLSPNKLSRQNIAKHLWECLGTATDASWVDIFNSE